MEYAWLAVTPYFYTVLYDHSGVGGCFIGPAGEGRIHQHSAKRTALMGFEHIWWINPCWQ